MLRVGLTGDLGSGKSTVAAMFAARGAVLRSSDEMARAMMQPGEAVYRRIVEHFGPGVLAADGALDRKRLASLAFDPVAPRVAELNAIVHPAVIAAQARELASFEGTDTIVVVESALIFSAVTGDTADWSARFDRVVLVTASEDHKIARFVHRALSGRAASADERRELEAEARRRLALQHTEAHAAQCLLLRNDGTLAELNAGFEQVWQQLTAASPAGL